MNQVEKHAVESMVPINEGEIEDPALRDEPGEDELRLFSAEFD